MTDLDRTLPPRAPDLMAQDVGDEIVVVDPATQKAHALSGVVAEVWRASASGQWSGDVNELEVANAIAELVDSGLLVEATGWTRRKMLQRVGMAAAGVGIATIALPMAEAAASGTAGNQMISLSPVEGPGGSSVTVTGTGFFPSGSITSVTIGGGTVTPSNTVISPTGTASFTFTVPNSLSNGFYNVSVTDNHRNTATAQFKVTQK